MSSWTLLIAAHAVAATTSLLLGGYQLTRRVKGDAVHRRIGWLWVAAMTFVATSSFGIREMRHGQLSLLHVLSAVTLVSLVLGIVQVRRGNLAGHRAAMRGSWFGLVGAGIAAVAVPGRRIPTLAVTDPLGALAAAVAIVVLTVSLVVLAHAVDHWRTPLARSPKSWPPASSSPGRSPGWPARSAAPSSSSGPRTELSPGPGRAARRPAWPSSSVPPR